MLLSYCFIYFLRTCIKSILVHGTSKITSLNLQQQELSIFRHLELESALLVELGHVGQYLVSLRREILTSSTYLIWKESPLWLATICSYSSLRCCTIRCIWSCRLSRNSTASSLVTPFMSMSLTLNQHRSGSLHLNLWAASLKDNKAQLGHN